MNSLVRFCLMLKNHKKSLYVMRISFNVVLRSVVKLEHRYCTMFVPFVWLSGKVSSLKKASNLKVEVSWRHTKAPRLKHKTCWRHTLDCSRRRINVPFSAPFPVISSYIIIYGRYSLRFVTWSAYCTFP